MQASTRTELLGGTTTFLAMAYIIVVNPAILRAAGLPTGASTVATIVVAAAGSFLMGVWGKRPIAVAPYMGENALMVFCLAALAITLPPGGACFFRGVVFLILPFTGLRGWLANAISPSLKYSFAAGIGLFLAFIGLNETGIVTAGTGVPVKIGNLRRAEVLLAIAGFGVIVGVVEGRGGGAS